SFTEKPTLSYGVSMGVYAVSGRTLARYPKNTALGFDQLVLDLLARDEKPMVYDFDGYWMDIGSPEDYERANLAFPGMRSTLLPAVRDTRKVVA
ncbi:sugar phosphate nucleotidyltransferase, partial [Streptomyces sp. NPDC003514]